MRKFLRRLLGLDADQKILAEALMIIRNEGRNTSTMVMKVAQQLRELDLTLTALRSDLAATFATDEFDAKRKAMSDELGQKVLKRLEAEDWARRHTEGKC